MDQVILNLGSDVNIFPKQTWERKGRSALQWSPIQLSMANQQKIIPMGRLQGVIVDIDAASTLADFEVIKFVDDRNTYPTLLGIDWTTDMNGVINLKKRKMIFEKKWLSIVVPLDLAEGPRYTEPVHDYESDSELDHIYKITEQDQDWVNLTIDGRIAWGREKSCTSDLDEELEHWQNRLHEVSTLHCNIMTNSLCCVSSEVRNLPYYDGLTYFDHFLDAFEREVPKKHHFQALDWVLHTTPARWWGMHKDSFDDWNEYRRMMRVHFGHPKVRLIEKYDGINDPRNHLAKWIKVYGVKPQPEWVHLFSHTLDVIPMNWYLETELYHGTEEWDILRKDFL